MRSPRRDLATGVAALASALAVVAGLTAPDAPAAPGSPSRAVLVEVNRVRAEHGLRPLRFDRRLAGATRRHVGDLLRRNVFEHGDVTGRLRRSGARGPLFSENLAWGTGGLGARAVVQMWLDSPPHRRNLLRPGWRRAGIGIADGAFSGYAQARVIGAAFAGA